MKLLSLQMKNFKGIKSFFLDTRGGNVNIYGDNATGKTTVFDAFNWLLFDKDSQNKKNFEIKTLDEHGRVIHGLDHEVEGVFEIRGRRVALRKVFSEKWTKKRGSAKATFTGHTTDYFIDGVPVKKSEYDAYIADIAEESIFKLLTSPTYFNEQLHWQERRKILLEICGDISDEEVIASDKALTKLPDILQGRKLEDHRKVIAARRSEINKELDKIPVRIDEVQRSLPDVTGLNTERLKKQLQELKLQEQEKRQEIARIESGGEIAEKQKQLREVEAEIIRIRNELNAQNDTKIAEKRRKLNDVRTNISNLQWEIKSRKRELEDNEQQITYLHMSMDKLREKWYQVNAEEFTFEQDDICPTCGQPLPKEQLDEAREKALKSFNLEKANKLQAISEEGMQKKAEANRLEEENKELQQQIDELQKKLDAEIENAKAIEAEIAKLQENTKDPSSSTEYAKKQEEKEALEIAIENLKLDAETAVEQVEKELEVIRERISMIEKDISNIRYYEQGQKRIQELKEEEKRLAAEYEKLEEELYLTEQFIRTKVRLLEEKINSRFKYARFKLFDVQVNGGVTECCETLYKGVPYSSGLNNAARINVGLDIINTLSEHYNFTAPIFVDNAEAVTELVETRGQMIKLIVSEPDKVLRVEHSEKAKMKEAV